MTHVTFLVKSEKLQRICLGCLDESNRWIRPIKPGGFTETDIKMDNGDIIDIFDVVDMKFSSPFPIKHHVENMKIAPGTQIKFVKKLSVPEQRALVKEIANVQLLKKVASKYELHDEIAIGLGKSLVLVGPIDSFNIQYNCGNHPKFWVTGKNGEEFDIRCTDIKFCALIKSKTAVLEPSENSIISSQDIAELEGKRVYFVIGLTGDSLEENNEIKDGRFAPEGGFIEPRYWPLVVSVLAIS